MSRAVLEYRIEEMLERYRGHARGPTRQEINDLYTDGCAAVMMLDTERLRVKRRLRAALFDSASDPQAAEEAAALSQRNDELVAELAHLHRLVRQLRAAVDWAQESADEQPPHFRRR